MEHDDRHTLPARVVASSFIVLILLGNCWFVLTLIGWLIPAWFSGATVLAVLGLLAGGLGFLAQALRRWLG